MRKRDSVKIIVGLNIRARRVQKGLTQRQLAEIVDCDTKYLCDIECGYNYPSSKLISRLAAALGVKVSALFTE